MGVGAIVEVNVTRDDAAVDPHTRDRNGSGRRRRGNGEGGGRIEVDQVPRHEPTGDAQYTPGQHQPAPRSPSQLEQEPGDVSWPAMTWWRRRLDRQRDRRLDRRPWLLDRRLLREIRQLALGWY